ncbi:MAG: hypothetical protein JKY32_00035 [Rhizobiales bacterium]|nr:hypothetical protein [Hyphomicrobiales bacterium]
MSAPSFAVETDLDPVRDHSVFYRTHEGKPVAELLSSGELSDYREALEVEDCDAAYALLTNAYAIAYPGNPHPGTTRKSSRDWERNVAIEHYPEIVFCTQMRNLREARAAIERDNIYYERFSTERMMTTRQRPKPLFDLDMAFWGLLTLARHEYPPAFLALAGLSDEGEVIRFTEEYQYYTLLRAANMGIASSELDELTSRASANLTPAVRAELRQRADNKNFDRSLDWLE